MMGVWALGRFRAWALTFALCAGCALALSCVWRIPAGACRTARNRKGGREAEAAARALALGLLPGILHNAYSDTDTGGGLPVAGAEFTALCKKAVF